MTRQATDVIFVVFAARPRKRMLILRVTLETGTVDIFRGHLCGTDDVFLFPALDVLFAIGVACFARSRAFTVHELGALAVFICAKGIDYRGMTSLAILTNIFLAYKFLTGLRESRPKDRMTRRKDQYARKGCDDQKFN